MSAGKASGRSVGRVGGLAYLSGRIAGVVFDAFYHLNVWRNAESRSGPGSTVANTHVIRSALPSLTEQYRIRTLLDIPCGDFNWIKEVLLDLEWYIGADISAGLIDSNNRHYRSTVRSFMKLDVTRDPLPQADLVLCRDCLVHLPQEQVWEALENIVRCGSRYLLMTSFPLVPRNRNLAFAGLWRPLNLQAAPFGLPQPLLLIDEQNSWKAERFPGKSLGLWRVEDIAERINSREA